MRHYAFEFIFGNCFAIKLGIGTMEVEHYEPGNPLFLSDRSLLKKYCGQILRGHLLG